MDRTFSKKITIIAVYLALLILYIAYSTNFHISYGQDALEFSYWIENDVITKNNRHFMWSFLFFAFYKIWHAAGLNGGALKAGQVLSAFFGAASVMIFYAILRNYFFKKRDYILGLIFSAFYAFSFAYWHFSGEANPQTFSNFLRLLLIFFIVKDAENISIKKASIYGIGFGVVLLSEIMGFYLLPVFMLLIYCYSAQSKKLNLMLFSIISVVFFYIFYGFAALSLLRISIREVIPSILWRVPNITDFLKESFLGPLYLLLALIYIPGLRASTVTGLEMIKLNAIFSPVNILFIGFLSISILIGIKSLKEFGPKEKGLAYAAILWFIILLCIQSYREPRALDNLFYILPPIWFMLFLVWRRFISRLKAKSMNIAIFSLIILCSTFASHNFIFGIYPKSKDTGHEMFEYSCYLKSLVMPNDDMILISSLGSYEIYDMYYIFKYKSTLRKSPILLDAYRYRPFVEADKKRYNEYASIIEKNKGDIYLLVMPELHFIKSETNKMAKLNNILKGIFDNSDTPHADYSVEVIEEVFKGRDKYITLDDKGLYCTLVKLIRKN